MHVLQALTANKGAIRSHTIVVLALAYKNPEMIWSPHQGCTNHNIANKEEQISLDKHQFSSYNNTVHCSEIKQRSESETMAEDTARNRRHARTKQAILDAAQRIIAERGTEGLSMREIAQRIEYSPSGLYEYFRGKDEIIQGLCDEGFVRLSERIRYRIATEHAPVQRLIASGVAYLEFANQHREQYMLMFNAVHAIHISLEEIGHNSSYALLKQVVQECIDAQEFKVREHYGQEEISYQLWALLHGIAMLRLTLFNNESEDFDMLNRHIIEAAIENLCAT